MGVGWGSKSALNVKVAQSCPTLRNPMDYTIHRTLQARILEKVAFPFSRGSSQPRSPALQVDSLSAEPQGKPKNTGVGNLSFLQGNRPDPGIEPGSPALQADSLPVESIGEPKNTGVGNLSFLQLIFLAQELNQALLHCRRILYQLNPRRIYNEILLTYI